ncbi:MAG: T9SS type A sorting domain-containing protein [Bacteroidetes bacterium]|nr:T9SS type A sorting domain-containing protein [Bacteroidota bacterium]
MKSCLSVLMILLSLSGVSQNFPVGHRSMNFTDTSRNNRAIPSEIYYPGTVAGNNVTIADGRFPVISFGHGFLMDYSVYLYLADSLESSSRITHMLSCTTPTGSQDLQECRSFLAYPSPAKDQVTVSTRDRNNRIHGMTIRSATGNLIFRKSSADAAGIESETLDLSGFSAGVYILEVEDRTRTEFIKMIRY